MGLVVTQSSGGISAGSCGHLGISVPDCSKSEAHRRIFPAVWPVPVPLHHSFVSAQCVPYVATLEIVPFCFPNLF